MERRVVTVLRSGGEYEPRHVRALARQVQQWAPDARFQCLSDVEIPGIDTIPLRHDWPKWYAKLELFRPDLGGGFLYTDLDNVIVGPIDDLFRERYTLQRPGWNALMCVPPHFGAQVYTEFCKAPAEYAEEWFISRAEGEPFGDAGFANQFVRAEYWEDVLPGQVVNIVELLVRWPHTHMTLGPIAATTYPFRPPSPGTRVVLCANPRRRPWKLKLFEHLYQGEA